LRHKIQPSRENETAFDHLTELTSKISDDKDTTENMETLNSTDSRPALWNPNAAACWSLVFSPAFGAYLHARNAEILGRKEEAKANRVWFYGSVIFFGLILISEFIPVIPDVVYRGAGLGILIGWYATLGTKQIKHVKDALQNQYERKSWSKPIAIGCGCIAAYIITAILLNLVVSAIFR
jgi:hypothetical protein